MDMALHIETFITAAPGRRVRRAAEASALVDSPRAAQSPRVLGGFKKSYLFCFFCFANAELMIKPDRVLIKRIIRARLCRGRGI